MPVKEIIVLHALAALVGPVQNIFSSPYTFSIPLSPSPGKAGQAVVLRRLSLSMSLLLRLERKVLENRREGKGEK